jgi:signal transduction histidine kinase
VQVLLDLLSNAVEFTREGSIRVLAWPAGRGDGLCLELIDTGVGIKEANLEAIFDGLTQVDQCETREQGGTGLALAISRKLPRLMGGSLSVWSTPGSGTIFTVILPPMPPVEWNANDPAVGSS